MPRGSGELMVRPQRDDPLRAYRASLRGIPVNFLSTCSARYFAAIANPWSDVAMGSCIPDGNSRASRKVTAFQRLTAIVGSAGLGFICTCPSIANDMPCIFYTTNAFGGTTCSPFVVSSAGVLTLASGWAFAVMSNMPYSAVNFIPNTSNQGISTTPVAGRIVSHAISAEYTGTVMNCGGLTECYNSADHSNLFNYTVGGTSTGSLGAFMEADIMRVTPDKKCWCPADFGRTSRETGYTNYDNIIDTTVNSGSNTWTTQLYPFSNGVTAIGASSNSSLSFGAAAAAYAPGFGSITNIIAFTGTASNSFNCEVVQHSEFVGTLAQTDLTPSTRDPTGFAHVQDAAARAPTIKVARRVSWTDAMLGALREIAIEYGPAMMKTGAKMLAGLLI